MINILLKRHQYRNKKKSSSVIFSSSEYECRTFSCLIRNICVYLIVLFSVLFRNYLCCLSHSSIGTSYSTIDFFLWMQYLSFIHNVQQPINLSVQFRFYSFIAGQAIASNIFTLEEMLKLTKRSLKKTNNLFRFVNQSLHANLC